MLWNNSSLLLISYLWQYVILLPPLQLRHGIIRHEEQESVSYIQKASKHEANL